VVEQLAVSFLTRAARDAGANDLLLESGGVNMAIGTWEDFTSKWGFNEGASTEIRDYEARALIIAELNEMTGVRAAKIRAIEYNRPGFHNSCLILILPNPEGRSDADLVTAWKANKLEVVDLPLSVSAVINEVVVEAYAQDIHDLSGG
jgi:hypothetical protein